MTLTIELHFHMKVCKYDYLFCVMYVMYGHKTNYFHVQETMTFEPMVNTDVGTEPLIV